MITQVTKGLLTYVPGLYRLVSKRQTGGTDSARYCYSVWLRHICALQKCGFSTRPEVVAELGPGDSLGIGLAALLGGIEKYYAFDLVQYAYAERNTQVFDELVQLFADRQPIPDEFPNVRPSIGDTTFPSHIYDDNHLKWALSDSRIQELRKGIGDETGPVKYVVPWYDAEVIAENTVDLIYSQAVLEHVDELDIAYERMYKWLRRGGFISHVIDYRSHGTANEWNGHWAYSDVVWKIIRGKRPYLINRQTHSYQLSRMRKAGFRIVSNDTYTRPSALPRDHLAPQFAGMSELDLQTYSAHVIAIKD